VTDRADRDRLAALATRWIALWNPPADRARFDALHAADFEDRASAGRPPTRDGFFAALIEMLRAFPDLDARVEDLVVDVAAGKVAVRWSATGTNRERYLGVGPTHRRTAITGIEIIELAGDQIIRRWGEWDITAHAE
jgi:steroid delta-isomerase-like uncharacterized protein